MKINYVFLIGPQDDLVYTGKEKNFFKMFFKTLQKRPRSDTQLEKILDPDPHEVNADPKPCLEYRHKNTLLVTPGAAELKKFPFSFVP
jgi:hypothetical protein